MQWLRGLGRRALPFALVFFVIACGDGGCSGCDGCAVQPIPGGYPTGERIDNAAQVRLTSAGLGYLESHVDELLAAFLPGNLDVPVPRTTGEICTPGVGWPCAGYTICTSNDCAVRVEVDSVDIAPTDPNRLSVTLHGRLDSRDDAGASRDLPFSTLGSTCQATVDTRRGDRPGVVLTAEIDLVTETELARAGYTKITVASAGLVADQGLENADIDIHDCSGALGWALGPILGALKGTIVGTINDQIGGIIQGGIDDQLCTKRGMHGCPNGTFAVPNEDADSVCRYEDDGSAACVPQLLGADGQGDLGAAVLGGFSAGTHAPGQFLLAASGDGEAVDDGLTLGFYGGFRSTDRTFMSSPSHNPCVPAVDPPPLPSLEPSTLLRTDLRPSGTSGHHVGIAIAEGFLDHAGYGLFDGGMLCLGVGTRLSQQLSSGLFSLLIGSLNNLVFPRASAPISMALRPQQPPVFTIDTDPATDDLLIIDLPELAADFYVFSTERYVRFMTFSGDVSIPLGLQVEGGKIAIAIGEVTIANGAVTHSELLRESPDSIARALGPVISAFVSMLGSAIDPFDVPSVMGFNLEIPEDGIVGFAEEDQRFLGIFANLAVPGPMPITATADAELEVARVELDPDVLTLARFGQGEGPIVSLRRSGRGPTGAQLEFSHRLDGMAWSPWTRDRSVEIRDPLLRLEARHVIEARAREIGDSRTTDPTPARVEALIDVSAPAVALTQSQAGVHVAISDILTPRSALAIRYGVRDEDLGEFRPATEVLGDGDTLVWPATHDHLVLEARDEAGNVGRAQLALIRGLPRADAGCACRIDATGGRANPPMFWLAFAGLGALVRLGRRRARSQHRRGARRGGPRGGGTGSRRWRWSAAASLVLLGPILLGAGGCDCGDGGNPSTLACEETCEAAMAPATSGAICCDAVQMCVTYDLTTLCDPGFTCEGAEAITIDSSCTLTCDRCVQNPPLEPGLLATHLDMAATASGAVWLSGYGPGVPTTRPYGDLVVGSYDRGSESVGWRIIDGVPNEPPSHAPDGWRGGVSIPGDDVGEWTSMTTGTGGLYVSYYDRTHRDLKVAFSAGESGDLWIRQTVDDVADSGRYSSVALLPDGRPAVAYLRIEPPTASPGRPRSSVRVAMADITDPRGGDAWTTTEVAAAEIDCRPELCDEGDRCLEDGRCVTPTEDCGDPCDSATACFMAVCEAALGDPYVEDMPPAVGLYNDMVATDSGLALVFYNRREGNLYGTSFDGATWAEPFLIDGHGVADPDVGDCGAGAALFVDESGVWHVTYIDGSEETLRYARVEDGVAATELVDDGSTDGESPHPDGRHLVGDDSAVVVAPSGEIRVVYQDATSHRAMLARRMPADAEWSIRVLDMLDHTGFWLSQTLLGDTSLVATFWREGEGQSGNGVRFLAVD